MDQKIKKKWVRALLSGKYKQARGVLLRSKTGGMCCLGVLAKIQGCSVDLLRDKVDVVPDGYAAGIPLDMQTQLAAMNDRKRHNFKQIAEFIKEFL